MNKIKLYEICDILNGYAFKSINYVDTGIRVIRITNVQNGYIEDKEPQFYPLSYEKEIQKYILKENDILISLTGNVGRVALLDKKYLPAALNQRVACMRLKNDIIYKSFLFHFLNSDFFENKCISNSKGIAQLNLSTEWLKNYEIPLYEFKQQIEIANKFDVLSKLIDNRKSQLIKIEELVKSRFIEMFGDPNINPYHWNILQLGKCIKSIDNGKSFVCNNNPRIGNAPAILKLSAVTYGVYKPEENKAIIDSDDFVKSAEVQNEDLLFTRKNTPDLVGMSSYVFSTPEKLMMPDLIFRINTKEICNKVFLWQFINHDSFRKHIQNIATGSAKSMSNISKERLMKLQIALPPIELQNKFANFVKQVDKSKFECAISLNLLE